MAIEIVPVATDEAFWRQRTALDGSDYILDFKYNERSCRWTIDIADAEGEPIVSGMRLSHGVDVLRLVTDLRRPPGRLVTVDLQYDVRPPRDPDFELLGDPVKLIYFDAEEVASLEGSG